MKNRSTTELRFRLRLLDKIMTEAKLSGDERWKGLVPQHNRLRDEIRSRVPPVTVGLRPAAVRGQLNGGRSNG